MIELSPAILTDDKEEFVELLNPYLKSGLFSSIDIDIQEKDFAGSQPTVTVDDVLAQLPQIDNLEQGQLRFDLKLAEPMVAVEQLHQLAKTRDLDFSYIVYHSSNYAPVLESEIMKEGLIAIGILGENKLPRSGKDLDYELFPEVQLMTIEDKKQGSQISGELLNRIYQVRKTGYEGQIAIDGGVNLRNAELIRAYTYDARLDRVSVGSYFQKSGNLNLDYQKLKLALNMQVE